MDIVTIDFETYYDRDYSLSKMTTEAYVRDPRFEVIGIAIKINGYPTDWYSGSDPGRFLRSLDYRDKAILCHNTAFDGAILSWHYGIRPKLWLDTLSMARPLHNITVGGSLKALASHYRLGEKGDEVLRTMGMRRADFTDEAMARFAEYCIKDVDLTYQLFRRLAKGFPASELHLIDQILRMYTEPTLVLDTDLLNQHLDAVVARRQELVESLGFEANDDAKATLMSNEKFAAYLRACGVEPPTKISKTTGKLAYAFSKTDKAFTDMVEHPDERVSTAVAARLGVKSTIEESRTRSLLGVATRGPLPILLNYYGAHTGRLSGGDKMNLQNLPRGGALRRSLRAPDGMVLVACDSSQIEARMVAWLAGQKDLVQLFADKRDVYCEFASVVYGRTITKADKLERFVGKTCLGPTTRVLTRRGWVPIIQVSSDDQLWDGVEWVGHCGVSFMGVKQTIRLSGLELTPDHEILTGATRWETARAVLKSSTAFQSALSLATLPSSGMKNVSHTQVSPGVGVLSAGAGGAVQSWHTQLQTCALGGPLPATDVPNAKLPRSGGGSTRLPYQTITIEADFSIGSPLHSTDATTQAIACSNITVAGGYMYATSGDRTSQRFSATFRPCQGGMSLDGTWTVSTTTEGMSREISGLLQNLRTHPINDESMIWRPVFDILNSGSRNRFTVLTDDGPIIVHNCVLGLGYGMGAAKFRDSLALGLGGVKVNISEDEAKRIVRIYRDKNHRIAALWYNCNTALRHMMHDADFDISPAVLPSLVAGRDGIRLPNGLLIRYPALQELSDGYGYAGDVRQFREALKAKVMGEKMRPDQLTRIYGGKVVENCLTGDTQVLTERGWVPLVDVRLSDRVWDGVEWVKHDGLIFQGYKPTTMVDGVRMTPDHKVLTREGWRCASSCEGLRRADFWLPDGTLVRGDEPPPLRVEVPMPVRHGGGARGYRRGEVRAAWRVALLRLQAWGQELHARYVKEPRILGVAVHGGSVQAAHQSGVAQLRRSRHPGMLAVGGFVPSVLGRYGSDLPSGTHAGSPGQRRPLHTGELPLGIRQGAEQEPAELYTSRPGAGAHHDGGSEVHAALPVEAEAVYDLRNAGPRTRFMVRGDGGPLIVHNCVQALARIVVTDQLVEIGKRYKVVLQVHDEVVIACSEDEAEEAKAFVVGVMSTAPDWARGLPVACEADVGKTYGDSKG